ncbi:uncharacterized protein ACMZJ9_007677 [Mantella aurantiaca]
MLSEMHKKEPLRDQALLEFGKPEKFEYLNQQPSPRLIATHITYEHLPKTFFEKKTKMLLILRNPKDTAVSYYHFSNNNPVLPTYESWDLFFKDYITGDVIYGSYFDYTLQWEKYMDNENLLVLTFEDMKADFPKELRKICDFYGLVLTDEQIKLVQEKTTFSTMKEQSSDTHGNLGNVFFRKGEIGDWKSLFTEEQSKEVDVQFEKYLAGTKLGNMINYEKYCTIYRILVEESHPQPPIFTEKWERELRTCGVEEIDWARSFLLSHKMSMVSRAQERNFKISSRWYKCPTTLHQIDTSISFTCWRCGEAEGNMTHIWGTCPKVEKFWDEVLGVYQTVTGKSVERNLPMILLSVIPGRLRDIKRDILRHCLVAARTVIARNWRSPEVPPISAWLIEMDIIHMMEEMLLRDMQKDEVYNTTWTRWVLYRADLESFQNELSKVFEAAANIPKDKMIFTYNGVLYPSATCDIDTLKDVETLEAREDDVMLVSYPKCGSNWSIMLLHSIVHAVHGKQHSPLIPIIEFKYPNKIEKLKAESSPRVLATHFNYDDIPKSFFEKKVKILVIFRNPKDTAVSFFHFYNNNPVLPSYNSFDDFFPDFMSGKVVWGSYFDHAVAWNKHLDADNILLMTFEDMKEDLEGSIKKISDFFSMPLTEEQVKFIAEKGTFKSMKENSKNTHGEIGKVIFRKGDVGDWKNYFSGAQSQEMDSKFEECLAGTKLGEVLKYNIHCK